MSYITNLEGNPTCVTCNRNWLVSSEWLYCKKSTFSMRHREVGGGHQDGPWQWRRASVPSRWEPVKIVEWNFMQILSVPKSNHNYLTHYHRSKVMPGTLFLPALTLSRQEKKNTSVYFYYYASCYESHCRWVHTAPLTKETNCKPLSISLVF